MKKLATILILSVFMATACNNPNTLPTIKKVTPIVMEIAKALCLVAAAQHPWEFGPLTATQWCNITDNIAPFFSEAEQVAESLDETAEAFRAAAEAQDAK